MTSYIEQAIKEAVEKGGYKMPQGRYAKRWAIQVAFLDPLFWQSLGQARGWLRTSCGHSICEANPEKFDCVSDPEWLFNWHYFIDHLAEGKDAESFFATLV